MLLPALGLLLVLPARADPYLLHDAGRPMPDTSPVALVVLDPGLAEPAVQALVDGLEAEGLDAWILSFPPQAQDTQAIVTRFIPQARANFPAHRPLALVGPGLGGTLAARAAKADPPAALALLGAPLAPPRSELVSWLCALPVPQGGLDLPSLGAVTWRDQPVLPLLLGQPPPPLARVSATWLRDLQGWARQGDPVDLSAATFPVWAGTGLLDELAPPEDLRPWLGEHPFVRFGYLRMDLHGYDHAALLREERVARVLARWLAQELAGG